MLSSRLTHSPSSASVSSPTRTFSGCSSGRSLSTRSCSYPPCCSSQTAPPTIMCPTPSRVPTLTHTSATWATPASNALQSLQWLANSILTAPTAPLASSSTTVSTHWKPIRTRASMIAPMICATPIQTSSSPASKNPSAKQRNSFHSTAFRAPISQ